MVAPAALPLSLRAAQPHEIVSAGSPVGIMSTAAAEARQGRVEFSGARHELLQIMMRGYALMIPSIGLYRFWQATWKRRFYWQNTVIDGDPLEYTGTPSQLLMGFFFALAFFLPIYLALFYFSMQQSPLSAIGYLAAGAVLWFLAGYGIYRARDFRLSRTLWRGIRFDQKGNAWLYATLRFAWSIAMLATAGLIYPWMGANLWRYRWRHTWFGDRKFEIGGTWRVFVVPYYTAYVLNVAAIGATIVWIATAKDFMRFGAVVLPGVPGLGAIAGCIVLFAVTLAWYRTRIAARMLSTVTAGDAALSVKLAWTALLGQYAAYVVAVVAMLAVLALTALLVFAGVYATASAAGRSAETALVALLQSGVVNGVLLIALYLVVLSALGLSAELILAFGWWRLLARGATIANPDGLRSVHAIAEDRSVIGQGLADALNVGAY